MYLDDRGLICTLNDDGVFDKNDQLQRVSMCYLVNNHVGKFFITHKMIENYFEESPGIYKRFPEGRTTDLSGDALLSVLAAFVRRNHLPGAKEIALRIIERKGFSQNIHDMYGRTEVKTPDFILFRALPLMWRVDPLWMLGRMGLFAVVLYLSMAVSTWFLILMLFVTDLPLIIMAVIAWIPVWKDDEGFAARTPDDVDDNVPIMTLIACASTFPTALSTLAPYIYAWLRPWNYGCEIKVGETVLKHAYKPVLGSLLHYHRLPRGNPEIANLYKPEVEKYFGEKNPEVLL